MFTTHPDWDQWEVLAEECAAQTYRDFQIVVVTPFLKTLTSSVVGRTLKLSAGDGGYTFTSPRDTPWRRERLFCAASARNSGLIYARGDLVVSLDDGVTFGPEFLDCIAEWWRRGLCAVPMYQCEDGVMEARWTWFCAQERESVIMSATAPNHGEPCHCGLNTYPLEAAIALNGYDEHFDGVRGLEDMNWSRRLIRHSVASVLDRNLIVTAHPSGDYPPEILDVDNQSARCCNPTYTLSMTRGLVANRTPYTKDEIESILHCFYWHDGRCGYWQDKQDCPLPWGGTGHPVAQRIMVDEAYPETFDLAAARRAAGVE